jgi:hypothetical protein
VFVEHVRRDRLDAFDFHLVFFRFELVFTPITLLSTTIHSRLLFGVFRVQKAFGQRELFRLADVFAHNVYVYFLSLYEENVPFPSGGCRIGKNERSFLTCVLHSSVRRVLHATTKSTPRTSE